jgi:tRNA-dihydrouridine synthase B
MIGRGSYGRPWLLGQVMHWLNTGEILADPTIGEQYGVIVDHYQDMLGIYGKVVGVNMARKHLGWYTKGLQGSAEFRNRVNFIDDPDAVLASLADFYGRFDPAEQRLAAA